MYEASLKILTSLIPKPLLEGFINKAMGGGEGSAKSEEVAKEIVLWWVAALTDAAKISGNKTISLGLFLLPNDMENDWWNEKWDLHMACLSDFPDEHSRFSILHCFLTNVRDFLNIMEEIHLPFAGGVIYLDALCEAHYRWTGGHHIWSQRVN